MKSHEESFNADREMLRVMSSHHFIAQDVFLSEHEPVALCTAQEKLLVATMQHCVEVRDLDRRGHTLHTFPTVDQVKQIIYCDSANYVATLERKSSRHSNPPITYVRAYLNWWIDTKGQPMKVRIAGCVTPSSQSGGGQLEMVELPTSEVALCIACCRKTGTLAVSLGSNIQIFSFCSKTHDISKQKFHDFDHVMDLQLSFSVREMAVCEDYFACLSAEEVHVFRVLLDCEKEESSEFEEDRVSSESDDVIRDEDCIMWRFDCCSEDGTLAPQFEEKLKSQLQTRSFPVTIQMKAIARANANHISEPEILEILGPTFDTRTCWVDVHVDSRLEGWSGLAMSNVSVVTLLFRRFAKHSEGLHGLSLLPLYFADKAQTQVDPLSAAAASEEHPLSSHLSPLCSNSSHCLKGLGCYFTWGQEGFLYNVAKEAQLVGQYTYTALAKSVAIEHCLLHALTETGLETYTAHLFHKVLEHTVPYQKNRQSVEDHTLLLYTQVCPSSEKPVSLLGLRPFLGVEQLVMADRHLVLVSTTDDSLSSTDSIEGGSCTLYSLRKPTPQQLFKDLLEVGFYNRMSNPVTYFTLLMEGHVALRSHLLLCGEPKCCDDTTELYKESCALLADYYACCEDKQDLKTAADYYVLSGLSIEHIMQRIEEMKNETNRSGLMQCLIQYLNHRLLEERSQDVASLPQIVAEGILNIYAAEVPDRLWRVILLSPLATYRTEKAMGLLKKMLTGKTCAADGLAAVVLLLRKGTTETIHNLLLSLMKEELVLLLSEVYVLLLDNDKLSQLGQIIKQVRPDAFVESFLIMTQKSVFSSDFVIELLLFESQSGVKLQTIPCLKEYLEALLSDKKHPDLASDRCTEHLAQIYLGRLQNPSKGNNHGSKTNSVAMLKSAALFGGRQSWLNELPPFNGKGITKNCQLSRSNVDSCPCWQCNEDLLRLQSLLCHANSASVFAIKPLIAQLHPHIRGNLSLHVLVSDWMEGVALLSTFRPSALLSYAKNIFHNDHAKWSHLFTMAKQQLEKKCPDDAEHAVFSRLYRDVLSHLAEMLHPAELVKLLPSGVGGTHDELLPYVKRCCEKHQAGLLNEKIISLGLEIKSMM